MGNSENKVFNDSPSKLSYLTSSPAYRANEELEDPDGLASAFQSIDNNSTEFFNLTDNFNRNQNNYGNYNNS